MEGRAQSIDASSSSSSSSSAQSSSGGTPRARVPHSVETPTPCSTPDVVRQGSTEVEEERECEAPKKHKGRRAIAWCCTRRVLSSFAMFFVLGVLGLITSSFGPALPVVVEQTNTFAHQHTRYLHRKELVT